MAMRYLGGGVGHQATRDTVPIVQADEDLEGPHPVQIAMTYGHFCLLYSHGTRPSEFRPRFLKGRGSKVGRENIGIMGHRQAENTLHRDAADRPRISAAIRSFILILATQTMARPSTFIYILSMVMPTARLGHQPNMYRASVGRIDDYLTYLGFHVPTCLLYMWAESCYRS
jgi:hypothetical protein